MENKKAIEYLNTKSLSDSMADVNRDLLNYFEGVSVERVESLIDSFRRDALKSSAVVTLKKFSK